MSIDNRAEDTLTDVQAQAQNDALRDLAELPYARSKGMGPALGFQLFDSSPDCVKLLHTDGTLAFMNEAGLRLMEVDELKTVLGQLWVAQWPQSTQAQIRQALDLASNGETSRFSAMCPSCKGREKWWDVVVSPFCDASINKSWILVVSRDVTEEHVARRRLSRSERQFRALADNIAQLAWMADASGAIYWYNRRWFDYTGTTHEDMVGWGWQKVHHPAHVDRVVEKISRHFEAGDEWEDTFPLRASDGSYRWFLSRAMPVHDTDGTLLLWCGTNTDVTEQRQASARLAQKARLIGLSHEAILVWDMEKGIQSWNKGCEDLYGYTAAEAVGRCTHDLLRTEHPAKIADFNAHLRSSGSWSGELVHYAKDGRMVWVESRQELQEFDGRNVVLEVNRDISDRKNSDNVRNLLIGELNHRVKNTLAIVQSMARQTARNSSDKVDFGEKFQDRLQALAATHHILTEGNWTGSDVHTIARTQLLETADKGGRIHLSGPHVTLPAQSALQVSLILHELATNARKYGALSSAGGQVDVAWIVNHEPQRRLHLTWREHGGPAVVEPRRKGFGLTLIERTGSQPQLLVKHQFHPDGVVCEITVDAVDDAAVVEPLFDPGRSMIEARPRNRSVSRAAPVAARILIIEDEPLIAMEMEQIITNAGFELAGLASTVDQAMTAVSDLTFDVALVDGSLHGAPVKEVVEALDAKHSLFIFVTGFKEIDLPATAKPARIVSKPIRPENLVATIKQTIAAGTFS